MQVIDGFLQTNLINVTLKLSTIIPFHLPPELLSYFCYFWLQFLRNIPEVTSYLEETTIRNERFVCPARLLATLIPIIC
jgi:hypothetical protein